MLREQAGSPTPLVQFYFAWFAIIAAANIAFVLLYMFLPKFKDASLKVPGQAYWLATKERREELVDRLRGIMEYALLGLNVFFLAVYQMIYQTNAFKPAMTVPMHTLVFFFMVAPMIMVVAAMLLTVRGLAKKAKG